MSGYQFLFVLVYAEDGTVSIVSDHELELVKERPEVGLVLEEEGETKTWVESRWRQDSKF
jgi:hypothetical protein